MQLFVCGDVMTGRGIDQILPHPSDPRIFEPVAKSALEYVDLAEEVSGPVPRRVDFSYIWGDSLDELTARAPDVRLINLETSVTRSEAAAPKGINYRMHPGNVACLQAARIDCCALANNHVLDWGREGLLETVAVLGGAGIASTGAGESIDAATTPAVVETPSGFRVMVWAFGSTDSGIPRGWKATARKPGLSVLKDLSGETARWIESLVRRYRQPGDLVVVSLHWGPNWGYTVPGEQRGFARQLIDSGLVNVVHGHSSHHPKAIEMYEGRPILYGCGDFINDYEGIAGREEYRPDLVLAYFVTLNNETRRLEGVEMVPFRSRRFRLERAGRDDTAWLRAVLAREGEKVGTTVEMGDDLVLSLRW